jgi:hypothetical protein
MKTHYPDDFSRIKQFASDDNGVTEAYDDWMLNSNYSPDTAEFLRVKARNLM